MTQAIHSPHHNDVTFITKCDPKHGLCEKAMQVRQSINAQLRIQAAAEKQLNESKSTFQKFVSYGLSKSIGFAAGAVFNGFTGGTPFAGSLFFLLPSMFEDWSTPTSITNVDELIALRPLTLRLISKATAIFAAYASLTYTNQEVSNSSLVASLIVGSILPALAQLGTREALKRAMEDLHQDLHHQASPESPIKADSSELKG